MGCCVGDAVDGVYCSEYSSAVFIFCVGWGYEGLFLYVKVIGGGLLVEIGISD